VHNPVATSIAPAQPSPSIMLTVARSDWMRHIHLGLAGVGLVLTLATVMPWLQIFGLGIGIADGGDTNGWLPLLGLLAAGASLFTSARTRRSRLTAAIAAMVGFGFVSHFVVLLMVVAMAEGVTPALTVWYFIAGVTSAAGVIGTGVLLIQNSTDQVSEPVLF
jgi:hypothetical protein